MPLSKPVNDTHYKPIENPRAYPLELHDNLHICLWSVDGTFKWTIAYWVKNSEGYYLKFVGDRPLDKRVRWEDFEAIIRQGQAIADKRFRGEWRVGLFHEPTEDDMRFDDYESAVEECRHRSQSDRQTVYAVWNQDDDPVCICVHGNQFNGVD